MNIALMVLGVAWVIARDVFFVYMGLLAVASVGTAVVMYGLLAAKAIRALMSRLAA